MPMYTLYYFNGRGRAEICRMMFAAAGVHYVDKRIDFLEWEGLRNDFPGRCLPVLEMDDGYKMPESMAICRYLAREYGFYGRTNLEMLRCDYICDCLYELVDDYMRYFHWKNGRFRSRIIDGGMNYSDMECCEMRYPAYDHYMYWKYMNTCNRILPFLDRTLEMCSRGNEFFMGDQITWCDMMFYCCLENLYMENESIFSCYPRLMGLWSRIASHPRIMYYLYNRCYSVW